MPTIEHTSAGGTRSIYRYATGPITWTGRAVNAFVVDRFPQEGGLEIRSILTSRILSENPDLIAGLWAVFFKAVRGLPVPEWQLTNSGVGQQPLPADQVLSAEIPVDVVRQLEDVARSWPSS